MFTCLCFCKCDVLKGGAVCIQLGVWFPHHKSHVTLICFLEILNTYVYIIFQLWLYKYLDISVTHVYILSSNWAVVEGILPALPPSTPTRPGLREVNCIAFPRLYQDSCQGQLTLSSLILVKASPHQSFFCPLFFVSFKFPMQSVVETGKLVLPSMI